MKAFLISEEIDVDDAWLQDCLAAYDADGSGAISLSEFALLVEQLTPVRRR